MCGNRPEYIEAFSAAVSIGMRVTPVNWHLTKDEVSYIVRDCEAKAVVVDADVDGYVAPPLEGIWASAPYLHNGSVPTLWHLLHNDSRPAAWKRRSAEGYDPVRVGLLVDEADEPPELKRADERRRWFYTPTGCFLPISGSATWRASFTRQ